MDIKGYFDRYTTDGTVTSFGEVVVDLSEKMFEINFDKQFSSLLGFDDIPEDDFGYPFIVTGVTKNGDECRVVFQWTDSPSIGKSETRYSYLVIDKENIDLILNWVFERCSEKEKEIKRKEESVAGEVIESLSYEHEGGYQVLKIHLKSGKIIEIVGSDMVSNLTKKDGEKIPIINNNDQLVM